MKKEFIWKDDQNRDYPYFFMVLEYERSYALDGYSDDTSQQIKGDYNDDYDDDYFNIK